MSAAEPEADLPPVTLAGHDAVQFTRRHLQDDNTDAVALIVDGGGDEGRLMRYAGYTYLPGRTSPPSPMSSRALVISRRTEAASS